MKYWFVSFAYKVNVDTATQFGNTLASGVTEHFSFMGTAQAVAEQNNWNSVTIINWKELHYLEYLEAMKYYQPPKERDVTD